VFATGKSFQHGQIFASTDRAYPTEARTFHVLHFRAGSRPYPQTL
jgi:hypothetical protein